MFRSEDEARGRFGPIEARLYQSVMAGLAEFSKPEFAELVASLVKRSHASNRNDLVWRQLRAEFQHDSDITFTQSNNANRMHLGNDWVLRVKKLDDRLRPRNIPTQSVLAYLEQCANHLCLVLNRLLLWILAINWLALPRSRSECS